MVAAIIILLIVLLAIFAPHVAPADPTLTSSFRRLRPIATPGFPLGTDEQGRDMLTRLIFGSRLSLFTGVLPVLIAFAFGSSIGIAAGYGPYLRDVTVSASTPIVMRNDAPHAASCQLAYGDIA